MTRVFLASSISFTPALNSSGFLATQWNVRLKQSMTWNSRGSTDKQPTPKLAAVPVRVPRTNPPFLLGSPCQDCCDCRWASCSPGSAGRSCCQGHLCRVLFASSWRWFMLPDGKGQSTIAQHNVWPTYAPNNLLPNTWEMHGDFD